MVLRVTLRFYFFLEKGKGGQRWAVLLAFVSHWFWSLTSCSTQLWSISVKTNICISKFRMMFCFSSILQSTDNGPNVQLHALEGQFCYFFLHQSVALVIRALSRQCACWREQSAGCLCLHRARVAPWGAPYQHYGSGAHLVQAVLCYFLVFLDIPHFPLGNGTGNYQFFADRFLFSLHS